MKRNIKELTDQKAVIKALAEYDRLGAAAFRSTYGFGEATRYLLVHEGREYDSKAIAGVAFGLQFPDEGTLRSGEFVGGVSGAARVLKSLGFQIRDRMEEDQINAWIFQSNPKYYDVRGASRARSEITWSINQYGDRIKPGHRVYMWEAGPVGGIVAVGTVLDVPQILPDPDDGYRKAAPEQLTKDVYRAPVKVVGAVEPVLTRDQIKTAPGLDNLSILQFGNATNFEVLPEEDEVLWDLCESRMEKSGDRTTSPTSSRFDELADRLLLDASFLDTSWALLEDRRQVVFYGPPGTGKTFVARELAREIAGPDAVTLVQFHPSYAYEDFVEGYRPNPKTGGFRLVDGPLKEAATRARESKDPHFLIVDEINRGNVAKVFGELYFLLEYRDEEIRLQYSSEPFSLPDNLYLIGTMNTADRSIALIDAALRRRFHFVGFFPQEGTAIGNVLRRWLGRHKPELSWIADAVAQANTHLDRHGAIGPSHFMKDNLDDAKTKLIWNHSIIPYIEEVFFGDEERVEEFRLERLRDKSSSQDGA